MLWDKYLGRLCRRRKAILPCLASQSAESCFHSRAQVRSQARPGKVPQRMSRESWRVSKKGIHQQLRPRSTGKIPNQPKGFYYSLMFSAHCASSEVSAKLLELPLITHSKIGATAWPPRLCFLLLFTYTRNRRLRQCANQI